VEVARICPWPCAFRWRSHARAQGHDPKCHVQHSMLTPSLTHLTSDRIHTSTTAFPKPVRVPVVVYNNSLSAVKVVESAHILDIATSVSLYEHTLTYNYNVQFQNGVCVCVVIYANNVQYNV